MSGEAGKDLWLSSGLWPAADVAQETAGSAPERGPSDHGDIDDSGMSRIPIVQNRLGTS